MSQGQLFQQLGALSEITYITQTFNEISAIFKYIFPLTKNLAHFQSIPISNEKMQINQFDDRP